MHESLGFTRGWLPPSRAHVDTSAKWRSPGQWGWQWYRKAQICQRAGARIWNLLNLNPQARCTHVSQLQGDGPQDPLGGVPCIVDASPATKDPPRKRRVQTKSLIPEADFQAAERGDGRQTCQQEGAMDSMLSEGSNFPKATTHVHFETV